MVIETSRSSSLDSIGDWNMDVSVVPKIISKILEMTTFCFPQFQLINIAWITKSIIFLFLMLNKKMNK